MIVRVWGTVNSTKVEFTPIPDKPGYWEGYAPRVPGIQDIEIWAESSTGARGHLQCTVQVREAHVHTEAYLVLLPGQPTLWKCTVWTWYPGHIGRSLDAAERWWCEWTE